VGVSLILVESAAFEHVSPLLCDLNWLRVPQWIEFRLAVLAYSCLSGTVPQYLARDRLYVSPLKSLSVRSTSSSWRYVPRTGHVSLLSVIGDHSFSVAAANV